MPMNNIKPKERSERVSHKYHIKISNLLCSDNK